MDKIFFLLNERKKATKLYKVLASNGVDYEVNQNDPPFLVVTGNPPARVVFKQNNFTEQSLFIVTNLSGGAQPCHVNINGVTDVLKLRMGTIALILASNTEILYRRGFWGMFAGNNHSDHISIGYGATNTAGGIAIGGNATSTNSSSDMAIGHNVNGYMYSTALFYSSKGAQIDRFGGRFFVQNFDSPSSVSSTAWTRLLMQSYNNSIFSLANNNAYSAILTARIRKPETSNALIIRQDYLIYYNSSFTPQNYIQKANETKITIGTVPADVDLKMDFSADGQVAFYGKTDGTQWDFFVGNCLFLGGV